MLHPEEATYVSVRIAPNPDCRLDHGLCSLPGFFHLISLSLTSHTTETLSDTIFVALVAFHFHISLSYFCLLTLPVCQPVAFSPTGFLSLDAPVLSPFLFV